MDFKIQGFWCLLAVILVTLGPLGINGSALDNFKTASDRQEFIRLMIQQSWKAYSLLAWGQESIHPVAPSEHLNETKTGETIFGALSTLWIADLKDEFAEAKEWIRNEFDVRESILADKYKARELYLYIGPLLSAFALSQDQFFLNKAIELAKIDSNTGLEPPGLDELLKHALIEFQFLTDLTGNSSYADKVKQYQEKLWEIEQNRTENFFLNGYPYETEVKRSLQSNGTYNPPQLQRYRSVLDSALETGLIRRFENWTTYHNLPFYDEMLYSHCNLGANLLAGARLWSHPVSGEEVTDEEKERIYREELLAEGLTAFCHEMAHRTATHLPAFKFTFNNETRQIEYRYPRYEVAPELAESYLALYRKTKDQKYRDQAWELTSAIYHHARYHQGVYGSVRNVDKTPTILDDYQPLKTLSATFKYLYLIYLDDDVLPGDKWIFNEDGHPFPICGQHEIYPESVCKKQQSTATD